ncbi:DNA polymerase III subunit beta [Candidatus Sumerlaeota bacterium]|nr:DNA polymerase III subunit beta [Candidatus Sumerlaeota bacterium]
MSDSEIPEANMKVSFNKEDLSYAVNVVHSVVNPQSSLPILSNILISAEISGEVEFIASDLETCVRCIINGDVADAGKLTVPASKLLDIVRVVPEDAVEMEQEENRLKIQCQNSTYRLAVMPPEEFPSWPEIEPVTSFKLSQEGLKRAIGKILFAIPLREPRRVLLGGLFRLKDSRLICVGTDGKRLGYVETEVSDITGEAENESIVPQKVLSELSHILSAEGEVVIHFGERQIAFDLGRVKIITSKIEGAYPEFQLVIPKEFKHIVKVSRDVLLEAIRRAAIISEEKTHAVMFKFQPEQALLSAMSYDVGSYEGTMPVEYKGEEVEVAFNHKFLQEIVRAVDEDEVLIKIKSNEEPIIFNGEGKTDYFFLVMPITLIEPQEASLSEEEEEEVEAEEDEELEPEDEDEEMS